MIHKPSDTSKPPTYSATNAQDHLNTESWASEHNFRLLLESAPVAIVTTDAAGRILYANSRLEEMFGYDAGELIGETLEALLPERYRQVHVEHRAGYAAEPHIRAMGSGMDLAGKRKNGAEFPIEVGLSHVRIDDRLVVIGTVTDLTRRKQTEEELEARVRQRTRELERRTRVSDSLQDILTILNSNRTVSEILDYITAQAARLLYADAATIYSAREGEPGLTLQSSYGISPSQLAEANELTEARDGRHALRFEALDDTESGAPDQNAMHLATVEGTRLNPDGHALVETGYRALLSVPLIVKEESFGSLMLYYSEPRKFSPEELELAVTVGDQAALAIENARLRTKVERTAVAAERNRIARDLHDSVTQTLFSATLIAEVLPKLWQRDLDESERRLAELRQLTRGALAEMRALLLELRPATLIEVDIHGLLRQLTEAITGRARVPISLVVEGQFDLPPDVKIALYHIAQEALNNVAKHARAQKAEVKLEGDDDHVTLTISDDGRGFVLSRVTADHLGLNIMRERAEGIGAAIDIESRLDEGAKVTLTWPAP